MENVNHNFHHWLLVANGAPLSATQLKTLAEKKKVLVLDGAFQAAKQADIAIDVLLGDFDSIDPRELQRARATTIHVVDTPDQNKTDLEKGLLYIDQYAPRSITLVAATGLRLQHTLFNLRILKKHHQENRELILISTNETIRYYKNIEINISGEINECIAVLGFPYATISTTGLKYDVTDYALQFEDGNSISNALAKTQATINIQGDALVIHEQLAS